MHDLRLRRSQSAFFAFTWLVVHPITPDSPLHGETAGRACGRRTSTSWPR